MRSQNVILFLSLSLALAGMTHAQSGYKIVFDVVDVAGNARDESAHYKLQDSVGQPSPIGKSDPANKVIVFSGFIATSSDLCERADFDKDKDVNFDDFFIFANHFGKKRGDPGFNSQCDLDGDGDVDFDDFFRFAHCFGKRF